MISDIKNPIAPHPSNIDDWTYLADIRNISNMYPYGKSYPATATYSADDDYRYGFNGMEKEKSFDSDGDVADFGARIFDANYPVFLSPDPYESKFSYQSTYAFAGNSPIWAIDKNGEHIFIVNNQRMTVAALDVTYETEIGREILSEFTGNNKHLIIFTGDIKLSADGDYVDDAWQARAYTFSNQFKDMFIKDGEINMEEIKVEYPNVYKEFSTLTGLKLEDLDISEDDKISLIKLGNYSPSREGNVDLFIDNGTLNIPLLEELAMIAGIHEPDHARYAEDSDSPSEDHIKMGDETPFLQSIINFLIQLGEHRNKDTDLYKFDQQVKDIDPKVLKDIIKKFEGSSNTGESKKYEPGG